MYLTLNDKNQLKVNFLIFPSYSDTATDTHMYRYNQLPYSFEWSKYKA